MRNLPLLPARDSARGRPAVGAAPAGLRGRCQTPAGARAGDPPAYVGAIAAPRARRVSRVSLPGAVRGARTVRRVVVPHPGQPVPYEWSTPCASWADVRP